MLTREQEDALLAVALIDPQYQQLNKEYHQAELKYAQVLSTLSEDDQLKLAYFTSRCREREYRKTCLVFRLGQMTGV